MDAGNSNYTDYVRDKYNQYGGPKDPWHRYAQERIDHFTGQLVREAGLPANAYLLNAGSSGNDHGLTEFRQMHVELAEATIQHLPEYIQGSVESIPLPDQTFDACVCVGSVLNYADGMKTIRELARLLKTGGILVIEFEISNSAEYLFTKHSGADQAFVSTFLNYEEERINVYSRSAIFGLLDELGLKRERVVAFHVLSPWIYRLTGHVDFAARFAGLDPLVRWSWLSRRAGNLILRCRKS